MVTGGTSGDDSIPARAKVSARITADAIVPSLRMS
jgi:hypothetical protein